MKNRRKAVFVGILLLASLFIAACNNIISPQIPGKTEKIGNVAVYFSGLSGRTLWPSALDFDRYEFKFSNGANEQTFSEVKSPKGLFTFNVTEGPGYNLNVKAYKVSGSEEILAAEGDADEVFSVNASTAVTVRLRGKITEGDGTFSFTVQYPAGAAIDRLVLIDADDIEINVLSGAAEEDLITYLIKSNSIDVPAGWYGLQVDLSDGNKFVYYDDIVSIYSNTATFYGTELEPIVFLKADFNEPFTKSGIIINQAVGTGSNPNGAIQYSFVELYNITGESVDISGWALQYVQNGSEWEKKNLAGAIPAKHSYLIRMNGGMDVTDTKLYIYTADIDWDIVISNDSFKFALTDHQNLLDMHDPAREDGVVDFVSATNNVIPDYWWGTGPASKYSKQQSARRVNFINTGDNAKDFVAADYRTYTGMDDSRLLTVRPRSLTEGYWEAGANSPPYWYEEWLAGKLPPADGQILFSRPAGLYTGNTPEDVDGGFDLELTAQTSVQNAVIRYTLNGEDPTSASPVYENPIRIINRSGRVKEYQNMVLKPGTVGTNSQTGAYVQGDINADISIGTVVKARLFNSSGQPISGIFVNSYFIRTSIFTRFGNLSFISVSFPSDYFFDTDTGIYQMGDYPWVANGVYSYPEYGDPTGAQPYTNYIYNFDQNWERPVYVEMFDSAAGYSRVIDQGMGARIHGGGSRHNPQKSIRLYARTGSIGAPEIGNSVDLPVINGKSAVDYDLFQGAAKNFNGNPITSFQRFVLRGHANDAGGALMRDPLGAVLSYDLDVETLAFRPVVVFLNGEFWGLYEIRERYDDRYLESRFGGNRSYYDILENPSHVIMGGDQGTAESIKYYQDTVAYLENKIAQFGGMNNANAYNEFLKFIDEGSLIDYVVMETFSNHADWINRANWRKHRMGNNQRIWRYTGTPTGLPGQDGRYRWMLYDLDSAFENTRVSDSLLYYAMEERDVAEYGKNEPNGSLYFFHRLIQNDTFSEKFFNRYMDIINTYFKPSVTWEITDRIRDAIAPAVVEQGYRWPYTRDSSTWQSFVNGTMKTWFTNRADPSGSFITNELGSYTKSGQTAALTLINQHGYMTLNGMTLTAGHPGVNNPANWTGTYFVGYTQVIEAVANWGKVFNKFIIQENTTGVTYDHMDSTLPLSMMAGGCTVTAVYTD